MFEHLTRIKSFAGTAMPPRSHEIGPLYFVDWPVCGSRLVELVRPSRGRDGVLPVPSIRCVTTI
jgi:hypothetical protein